jgi:hypothetical protein
VRRIIFENLIRVKKDINARFPKNFGVVERLSETKFKIHRTKMYQECTIEREIVMENKIKDLFGIEDLLCIKNVSPDDYKEWTLYYRENADIIQKFFYKINYRPLQANELYISLSDFFNVEWVKENNKNDRLNSIAKNFATIVQKHPDIRLHAIFDSEVEILIA